MADGLIDKHRNPDGTVDGLAVLGELSGLGRASAQDMLAQVQANRAKLDACPAHAFAPIPPVRLIGQRYRCESCGGEIDAHAYYWFMEGRKK